MIYDTLDAAILNAIKTVREGYSSCPTYDTRVLDAARRIDTSRHRTIGQIVSGRLQSLRKRGVIRYWQKNENPPDGVTGWRMVR